MFDSLSKTEEVKTALTETERAEAQKHEKIVDKGLAGYVSTGTALGTLHDERLFVGPFRAYVEERFDLRYHTANRRIVAARVARTSRLPVCRSPPSKTKRTSFTN